MNMLHKDDIDLSISRILQADHEPCGIALIARRGALRPAGLLPWELPRQHGAKGLAHG